MTKEQKINKWVSENYRWLDGQVSKNIAKSQMSEFSGDLLHHIILDLYNLPEAKIDQMIEDEKLKWYVLRGAGLQLRSKTSPFYRIHRRTRMESRENYVGGEGQWNNSSMGILDSVYEPYQHDELWDCFQREVENLHWYQKHLVNRYFIENWTLQQLFETYNISKTHIIKDINTALDTIREKCKDC